MITLPEIFRPNLVLLEILVFPHLQKSNIFIPILSISLKMPDFDHKNHFLHLVITCDWGTPNILFNSFQFEAFIQSASHSLHDAQM
jgi:hypothetical protein